MCDYKIHFKYKIGDELYFCEKADDEAFAIYKVLIDHIYVTLPLTKKSCDDPNHYFIKYISPDMEKNEDRELFAKESELFNDQSEAIKYCYDKLLEEDK
jgi:hypothetical protein